MLQCFPASPNASRPARGTLTNAGALVWCSQVQLFGALALCTWDLHQTLGRACTLHQIYSFKTSAWACAYYLLSGRIGGMLMTAARCRELDALNGLCTLCSPYNMDEAESISISHFGTNICNLEHLLFSTSNIYLIHLIYKTEKKSIKQQP